MAPQQRRILRLPATQAKVGLGHDSIYRLARESDFPKPIKLSERASGWFEDELDAWLAKRAAERDGVAAEAPPATGRVPASTEAVDTNTAKRKRRVSRKH